MAEISKILSVCPLCGARVEDSEIESTMKFEVGEKGSIANDPMALKLNAEMLTGGINLCRKCRLEGSLFMLYELQNCLEDELARLFPNEYGELKSSIFTVN